MRNYPLVAFLAMISAAAPAAAQDVLIQAPDISAQQKGAISCPFSGAPSQVPAQDVTLPAGAEGSAEPARLCLDPATKQALAAGQVTPRQMLERTRARLAADNQLSPDVRAAMLKSVEQRLAAMPK